jgi:hypothetical protein
LVIFEEKSAGRIEGEYVPWVGARLDGVEAWLEGWPDPAASPELAEELVGDDPLEPPPEPHPKRASAATAVSANDQIRFAFPNGFIVGNSSRSASVILYSYAAQMKGA